MKDVVNSMIDDIPFSSVREGLYCAVLLKEMVEIEDFKSEINSVKRQILTNIHAGQTITEIKIIIVREMRKLTNKLIVRKETCMNEMKDDSDDSSD